VESNAKVIPSPHSIMPHFSLSLRDDAHIQRDGIDNLTPAEIEEAAVVRGYSHTNSHKDQKQYRAIA
jgi:hypothetical protein